MKYIKCNIILLFFIKNLLLSYIYVNQKWRYMQFKIISRYIRIGWRSSSRLLCYNVISVITLSVTLIILII